ncbi:MAG: TonB-dependent receptor plug domain-containing protein [Oceanospirillaceae bacterium]|nr:TonB-dependent receptor plug domain-containing protein [Oceanospirillaceae bacterium]MCP5335333.1 TonB-dependent receptor plug domain-containing protein [Oceanospirillaceae bacterium]MCP5350714.1 TonB-dependent receptor plug domain-containing protein [Oceanospirillaceae bacterium]
MQGFTKLLLIASLSLVTPFTQAEDDWEQGWNDDMGEIPVVLTATRMRQSQLDTPASVTIIDADTIERMGFRDIEDVFRLVPGMLVGNDGTHGGKQTTVTYHGTQGAEHRRLQVLIDGRSVYKPALPSVPRVSWTDIPLAIEDVQRIEVIRGPNSAAYGANSFMGVINIITKRPEDVEGTRAKVTNGSNGIHDYYVGNAGKLADTSFRLSISGMADKGFDELEDKNGDRSSNRDSRNLDRFILRTSTDLGSSMNLEMQAGYKTGINQQRDTDDKIDYQSPQDTETNDGFLWTRLHTEFSSEHSSQFQLYYQDTQRTQEFRVCIGNYLLGGNGGLFGLSNADYCADTNLNGEEKRADLEYQDNYTWNEVLRTVAGFRLRREQIESETYIDGIRENDTRSLFANAEVKLHEAVTLNLGASWEDDEAADPFLAKRAALNLHISSHQVLRFIYSEAVRSPNIYEEHGQQIYHLTNASRSANWDATIPSLVDVPLLEAETAAAYTADSQIVVATAPWNLNLDNEKIRSNEISYFGMFDDGRWQLDAKLYRDEMYDLISEPLGGGDPLTNDTSFDIGGFETQIKWMPGANDESMLNYAYTNLMDEKNAPDLQASDNKNTVDLEIRMFAMHTASLAWMHRLSAGANTSLAYYYVDRWNNNYNYTYKRLDLGAAFLVPVNPDMDLRLALNIQYRLDDDPLLWRDNYYNDKYKYYASAELKF